MQTPKARNSPRSVSSEASQKKSSPQAASASASSEAAQKISPRVVRQLKTGPRYFEHTASSSNLANKAPKERSPKVDNHKSPRSPAAASSEKKRPSRVSELESQISQLENDLQTVKNQLCSTEALKKQAQKDAEESNQQLLALSLKLQEAEKPSEDPKDEASKSDDSAALASALDEIKQLKFQLQTIAESEAAHFKSTENDKNELEKLKENLSETLLLLEDMKKQLKDCKESEAQAQAVVGETLTQLEEAKKLVETLRSDGIKAREAYDGLAAELDESRARINFLEELVGKLEADISKKSSQKDSEIIITEDKERAAAEVNSLKLEVENLKSALEASETRNDEERARIAEQMRNASEMVENIKSLSDEREAELDSELKKSKYKIEELKANLMDKETELQGICEENEGLSKKLESTFLGQRESQLENEVENLKARLTDKEREWQNLSEQNEKLKLDIMEMSRGNLGNDDEIVASARASEREALMKVGYMTEEVDKSNRKVARASEQLEAAQAANAEMEAELKKLKVQSDQWRKAAEAAAAMLSAGNNGGLMERTGSMDSNYSPRPYGDDLDEEFMKKKNANMLRRLGVLWKKPQK